MYSYTLNQLDTDSFRVFSKRLYNNTCYNHDEFNDLVCKCYKNLEQNEQYLNSNSYERLILIINELIKEYSFFEVIETFIFSDLHSFKK